MKVLHVIPGIARRYGGPSRAVVDMCRALASRGVDTLVATTNADGPSELPNPLGTIVQHEDIPAIFFRRQWSERFKFSRPLSSWLAKHVREFDVVHVHAVFSHASLAATRACARTGRPYLVRPLGSLDPWSLGQNRLAKRLLWHAGVGRMLRNAAAIHYTSEQEKAAAEERLRLGRGVVVPLGLRQELVDELDRIRRDGPAGDEELLVLYLSRLHPKKSPEMLIEAFREIVERPELRHARLVLAGDGAPGYVARLRRQVERCGMTELVAFAGWIDGAAKSRLLSRAAILALPSSQENFAIAAVEAMGAGIPVAVSDRVALASRIDQERAGWVLPLDAASWARVIGAALADPEERRRRGERGRALVRKEFMMSETARRLEGVYAGLLGKSAA